MIKALQEKRAELRKSIDTILETLGAEKRTKLTDEERGQFDAAEAEIREIDARCAELDEQIRTDEAAAEMATRYAQPQPQPEAEQRRSPADLAVTEQPVYRSGPGGRSYFRDLYLAKRQGDASAMERLRRNDKMVAEKRGLTTVAGAGGKVFAAV